MKPMKTVFVGCGGISEIYIENCVNNFSIIYVYGCCDLKKENAERIANKYNIKQLSMEEILKDETIELVVNLTAPKTHYEIVKKLLLGGKHVYTEKTLATSLEEGAELLNIANEQKRELCVAPDTFLGSAIQNAKQLVDKGMLGDVTSCRVSLTRNGRRMTELLPYLSEEGSDIGLDVAIYHITALIYILGPITSVCGFARTNEPDRIHYLPSKDNFGETYKMKAKTVTVGCMEFENGALGTMLFNSDSIFIEQPSFKIMGRYGILDLKNPDEFGGDVTLQRNCASDPIMIPSIFAGDENLRGMGVAEMAWSIRANRKPRANKEMAYHALEALLGIKMSNETGKTYKLQSTFEAVPQLPQGFACDPYLPEYEAALV